MTTQCILCEKEALHNIKYEKMFNDYSHWEGSYCTKCFVKKLQGMTKVWRKYDS